MIEKPKKKIKHFTDLIGWQKAHQLFLNALKAIKHFPKTRAGTIVSDQIMRSIGSISAKTAEGFNARSIKKNVLIHLTPNFMFRTSPWPSLRARNDFSVGGRGNLKVNRHLRLLRISQARGKTRNDTNLGFLPILGVK
jgi:hypothetical protein